MRVLITGARGFVGKELTQRLISEGHEIYAAVRSGQPATSGVRDVLVSNTTTATEWQSTLQNVDVVFHLAARVHVMKDNSADPLAAYLQDNLQFTTEMAMHAATAGVKRFVFISSIKVNGESTNAKAFTEIDKPDPQDPYAISKLHAEESLLAVASNTGMEVVILRPPLVYGPGVKANFRSLLQVVDRMVPLPLSCISNTRSLIYVGNLVDALILCATHAAAKNQLFLICDETSISTPQLIKNIAFALGRPCMLFPFPLSTLRLAAKLIRKGAFLDRLTQSLMIDNTKIRNLLNWKPPYTMKQGLKATAKAYIHNKKEIHK